MLFIKENFKWEQSSNEKKIFAEIKKKQEI